jgi:hypothetical protein
MFRFLEIGTCYHEFLAPGVDGALDHVFEVIFVAFGTVVFAPVDGVCKVDAVLGWVSGGWGGVVVCGPTSMYFSWVVSVAISDILDSDTWEIEALTGICIRISPYKERQYDDALVKFLKGVPMYLRGRNLTVCCVPELKTRC